MKGVDVFKNRFKKMLTHKAHTPLFQVFILILACLNLSCCGMTSGAGSGRALGLVRSNSLGSVFFLGDFFGRLPLPIFLAS